MRRGYYTEVDRSGSYISNGHDGVRLEDSQQLALHVEFEFAYLVEEERALVGSLDKTGGIRVRSGEGSLLGAKEQSLSNALRDGSAVDGNEGLFVIAYCGVKVFGGEFLADPRLAA
jgi:hypothetical protein